MAVLTILLLLLVNLFILKLLYAYGWSFSLLKANNYFIIKKYFKLLSINVVF